VAKNLRTKIIHSKISKNHKRKGAEMTDDDIKVPFGHWGIFTSGNFDINGIDEDGIPFIKKVPVKVWDHYHPIEIKENGTIYKLNKLTGRYVLKSFIRSQRNHEVSVGEDILKNIIEGKDPFILIATEHRGFRDNVFSKSIGNQNIEDVQSATILNRFPAFVRLMEPEIETQVKEKIETTSKHLAKGVCLVSFPTQFYEHLREMQTEHLYSVLKSAKNAVIASVEAAHDANIRYMPTSMFINTDKDTGRSLRRFHVQIYIDMTQDGHDSLTEAKLKAFEYHMENGGCHYCRRIELLDTKDGRDFSKRLVYRNDNWMLWVSDVPIVSYHLKFAPTSHIIDVSELDDFHMRDLADLLITADNIQQDYNLIQGKHICINQRPFDYNSQFHLYGDILPNDNVGGYEKMGDSKVDTKPPAEYIAAALREIARSYKN